jgi:hypothetical protein
MAMPDKLPPGPVEQAVRRDLKAAGETLRAPSGLAASALALAQQMDGNLLLGPRDAATVAAELRQTLAELRKRAPQAPPQEDSLAQRRARRAAARPSG